MSLIFALDSSGMTASVRVEQNDTCLYEELLDEGLTHSETLLCLAERAFDRCRIRPEHVSAYAVTAGPGSFTGLRIGLSLVKGLAFPFSTPVIPVSTLEAMALATGERGYLISAINARRNEVYWAAFHRGEEMKRLHAEVVTPAEEVAAFLKKLDKPVIMVGDGAKLCYTNDDYSPKVSLFQSQPVLARGAALLAKPALKGGALPTAEQAAPVYLRLSQAERERLGRI
ncbi:tRNA (adenosine(37)-N6)-threonylcarbamoyltransferase complex dimerization subunit type 1 TsaB [Ruminococcaceae bacterium OttesenSCG-928-I18]|nr:tRNA (adenosine(37)-N6)-threonylcarbamoyltransferase complex dimerization subunit type 1 TsaB [Ruminococcaceae bacterium OttesenSCG-928-I18]